MTDAVAGGKAMKRLLIVLSQEPHAEGEGWKRTTANLRFLRRQIRRELKKPVPVVLMPAGVSLTAIEYESSDLPVLEDEPIEGA